MYWIGNRNEIFLNGALGYEKGPQYCFLAGILFATSTSKAIVPQLQDVIQADGAHTSFGKYTLLSAYRTTANCNMSPLAFGIMFGNEDTGNWTKFWELVKEIHPSVNAPTITILTDQDKGSITAILLRYLKRINFIVPITAVKISSRHAGGHGQTPLTALWMYNLLCGSKSMSQLHATQEKYYPQNGRDDVQRNQGHSSYALLHYRSVMQHRALGGELVTCLLEVTHGQWLFRNIQVHDRITVTLATEQKEELQMNIEHQQELGMEDLLDVDCYLAE